MKLCYCDFVSGLPTNSLWCQREEDKEENRLSEEAERSFDQLQCQGDEDEAITIADQTQASAAHPDVTYQVEDESQAPSSTIVVPAIVTAT